MNHPTYDPTQYYLLHKSALTGGACIVTLNQWGGLTTNAPDTEERGIRLNEVIGMVGLSKTTIYELISTGKFPAPLKLSTRASIWKLSAVQSFLQGEFVAKAALKLVLQRTNGVQHG